MHNFDGDAITVELESSTVVEMNVAEEARSEATTLQKLLEYQENTIICQEKESKILK